LLGFRLTDYLLTPITAYFLHVNSRHHSLALIETGRNGIHHLMVELFSLDDVGQGYDIALTEPARIATTLGRHPNDCVMSYYLRSPAGFMLEYGWAVWRSILRPGSRVKWTQGPSLWGHERSWLSPEKQAEAREMRFQNGGAGRAPAGLCDGGKLSAHVGGLPLVGRHSARRRRGCGSEPDIGRSLRSTSLSPNQG